MMDAVRCRPFTERQLWRHQDAAGRLSLTSDAYDRLQDHRSAETT